MNKVTMPILPIFPLKLVALAMSLEQSKKKRVRSIIYIPTIWWKPDKNRSSRSWDDWSPSSH